MRIELSIQANFSSLKHLRRLAVYPDSKSRYVCLCKEPHNVFTMFTNPEWILARSIHNGNKHPTDLETYFQNGNRFYLIWIPIQRKFPDQLETVSKQNGNHFHFGNMYPNQMGTIFKKNCFQIKWKPLLLFWILLKSIQNGIVTAFFRRRIHCVTDNL